MFGAKLADVNPMLLNREPRLELDWLDMVRSYSTRCSLQWWLFIYSNHIQLLIRWDWEGRCSLRGCCHSPSTSAFRLGRQGAAPNSAYLQCWDDTGGTCERNVSTPNRRELPTWSWRYTARRRLVPCWECWWCFFLEVEEVLTLDFHYPNFSPKG